MATIDAPLKGIEAKFKVKIRAIQDDITMMGDPEQIFGPDKALESLLLVGGYPGPRKKSR